VRANDVLSLWERGERGGALDHTLAILTGPLELDTAAAEGLPLGERDRQILGLHTRVFGSVLHARCRCPQCDEQLMFDLPHPSLTSANPETGTGVHVLESGDLTIEFRLPNSGDVRAASRAPDVLSARSLLVERCVQRVVRGGETIAASALTEGDVAQLAEQMTACDPLLETMLEVECPACAHQWEAVVEVGEFFWAELSDLAGRLSREVLVLARAFHWSEAEILAMSPRRRRLYLELAEA
jgi:hypothetical protein